MKARPRALVRADAGPRIGSGHVMRCLSLAQALNESGWTVYLLSAGLPEVQHALWSQPGREVIDLPPSLHAGSELDSAVTAEQLRKLNAEALIVDHYALDGAWEEAANPMRTASLAIDDPPLRDHSTDWLLNQNLVEVPTASSGTAPDVLEGPGYALLRPEFLRLRGEVRRTGKSVRRVLVNLGGFDPQGYTWPVVQLCRDLFGPEVTLDVVVGPGNPDLHHLQGWSAERSGRLLTVQAQDMAARMLAADIAVGAGGSSAWERCCMGLPSATVVLADNQQAPVRLGQRAGVLLDGGDLRDPSGLESLAKALSKLRDEPDTRQALAQAAQALVDGQGARRVADCIIKKVGSDKA